MSEYQKYKDELAHLERVKERREFCSKLAHHAFVLAAGGECQVCKYRRVKNALSLVQASPCDLSLPTMQHLCSTIAVGGLAQTYDKVSDMRRSVAASRILCMNCVAEQGITWSSKHFDLIGNIEIEERFLANTIISIRRCRVDSSSQKWIDDILEDKHIYEFSNSLHG